jgi:DNA-binding XRE family transcriptional regulator
MDMHISSTLVKTEREKRAWSQEQLAAAAGVGLRTIQRVEATGVASNETALSLAAVFQCHVDALRTRTTENIKTPLWKRPAVVGTALSAVVALILSIAFASTRVQAREIMLDVILKTSSAGSSTFKMLTTDGAATTADLDKEVKLVFLPALQKNNLILITREIYEYEENHYVLIAKPKVMIKSGIEGRIQVSSTGGKIYDISIKPTTQ